MEDKWNSWSQGKVYQTNVKCSDRMAQDLVRKLRRTHTSLQKSCKKSSRHRSSCSQDNNTTYFKQQRPTWQSCQKEAFPTTSHKIKHLKYAKQKTLRSLKPFGTMCFGLTKPKYELFGHHQRRYLLEKKGEAFVEKNTLPTVKHGGGSILLWGWLCGSWGHRKYCASGRKNGFHQISRNSRGWCSKVSPQTLKLKRGWNIPSRQWSKAYLEINHEVPPGKMDKVLEWSPPSPDLNIIENLWRDLKHPVHARRPKNISELEVLPEEWEKFPKARIERLLAGYRKCFQAVMVARRGAIKY